MGKTPKQPADPAVQALDEAEGHQQRGERRAGSDAIACFEKAAAAFRRAIDLGITDHEKQQAALSGLAETLQQAADAIIQEACSVPDGQFTPGSEDAARGQALGLYATSAETWLQVREPAGTLSPEAVVNCGNVLCSWAESLTSLNTPQAAAASTPQAQAAVHHMTQVLNLRPWSASLQGVQCGLGGTHNQGSCVQVIAAHLLDCACGLYTFALTQDNDALTHSNLGDALITWAEVLWELDATATATAVTSAALQHYQESCALTDSNEGDDLPGLLCNWGLGLASAGQKGQDWGVRTHMLQQAESRLSSAAEFMRGDPAPLIGLGDVLTAQAELLQAQGNAQGLDAVRELHTAAVVRGYGAALRIQGGNTEALLGAAESHTAILRLHLQAGGSLADEAVAEHVAAALRMFSVISNSSHKLGGFQARCEARYNWACFLAITGRDQESAALLSELLLCGGIKAEEVAKDSDLAGRPWVHTLLQQAPAASATCL